MYKTYFYIVSRDSYFVYKDLLDFHESDIQDFKFHQTDYSMVWVRKQRSLRKLFVLRFSNLNTFVISLELKR